MDTEDVAWFKEIKIDEDVYKNESFDNIDCITIERIYQRFKEKNSENERYVALGKQTVDLKEMVVTSTNNDSVDKIDIMRGS